MSVNGASAIIIDDSRVMLQIAASLTDDSRGIVYDHIIFKVQATGVLLLPDTCIHVRYLQTRMEPTKGVPPDAVFFEDMLLSGHKY
jgi:hypothetical protein